MEMRAPMERFSVSEKPQEVAVVLPVYGVEAYLKQNLDSLVAQTYPYFAVFAVDDGSPDGSLKILDEYAERDERIKVFHQENKGPSAARNLALDAIVREGHYQYVAFLDADDYVSPEWLQCFVEELSKEGADYGVCSYRCFTREGMQPPKGEMATRQVMDSVEIAEQFFRVSTKFGEDLPADSTSSYFLNNRFFRLEAVKGVRFNEEMRSCEDRDFLVRAMPSLRKGVKLPEILFFYRRRISSLSNGRSAKVTDFLVYQRLYEQRHLYSDAVRVGLQTEFLSHMLQELYAKLSNDSSDDSRQFFRYCVGVSRSSFEFPVAGTVRRKLKKLERGYMYNLAWAYARELLRRGRNAFRNHRYFA